MHNKKVSKRHIARQMALKHLYAMQLGGSKVPNTAGSAFDNDYYDQLVTHVLVRTQEWDDYIGPCLDQENLEEITQVDRAILWIGGASLKSVESLGAWSLMRL